MKKSLAGGYPLRNHPRPVMPATKVSGSPSRGGLGGVSPASRGGLGGVSPASIGEDVTPSPATWNHYDSRGLYSAMRAGISRGMNNGFDENLPFDEAQLADFRGLMLGGQAVADNLSNTKPSTSLSGNLLVTARDTTVIDPKNPMGFPDANSARFARFLYGIPTRITHRYQQLCLRYPDQFKYIIPDTVPNVWTMGGGKVSTSQLPFPPTQMVPDGNGDKLGFVPSNNGTMFGAHPAIIVAGIVVAGIVVVSSVYIISDKIAEASKAESEGKMALMKAWKEAQLQTEAAKVLHVLDEHEKTKSGTPFDAAELKVLSDSEELQKSSDKSFEEILKPAPPVGNVLAEGASGAMMTLAILSGIGIAGYFGYKAFLSGKEHSSHMTLPPPVTE